MNILALFAFPLVSLLPIIKRSQKWELRLETVCCGNESLFNVNVWLSGFIKDQELRCYNKIKSSARVVTETINRMTRKLIITKKVLSYLTKMKPGEEEIIKNKAKQIFKSLVKSSEQYWNLAPHKLTLKFNTQNTRERFEENFEKDF